MMLRRIDGACDSLLFVSSPRCENTTARQTAAHPLRGYTPLRRQHGEELEPSHRAFLRGSGSRINYSRSGPCTAAKATTQCPLWVIFVRLARSRRSRHVRFAPKADNAGSLRYVRFVPSVQRDCHHLTARAVSPGTTATIRTRQHTSGMPDGLTCFSTSSSEAAPSQARASAACGLSQCQHGKLIRSSGISIHRCPPNQRVWQINDSTVAFFTAEFEITPEQFIHRGSELGHFNFQLTNLFTLLS